VNIRSKSIQLLIPIVFALSCAIQSLAIASHDYAPRAELVRVPVLWGALVESVTDGDTIRVKITGRHYRVQLAYIDAPELAQPYGGRAKEVLAHLINGRLAALEPIDIDQYGRLIAIVYTDGRDVGLELLKRGYAWPYVKYLHESTPELRDRYAFAGYAARQLRVGLWRDPKPIAPWDWRLRAK